LASFPIFLQAIWLQAIDYLQYNYCLKAVLLDGLKKS